MLYAKSLLIVFLLFYFDCGSVKNSPPQNQNVMQKIPNDLQITLERTVCYGRCPAYKLSVKADGTVLFEGIDFTKVKGKTEGKISEEKLKQLVKAFQDADYFNLNGKYDYENCNQMTDHPSATTSIQMDGKTKTIGHYHGCKDGSNSFKDELVKLSRLEDKIDEIVETKRWIDEQK
ncbi:MAG TPA: DUF6438 domain-containing protein [Pyrinomonadaceae bacterium]|nr:DUF6438 domain-containing protein [Pyrinomonadaceae bacterium]